MHTAWERRVRRCGHLHVQPDLLTVCQLAGFRQDQLEQLSACGDTEGPRVICQVTHMSAIRFGSTCYDDHDAAAHQYANDGTDAERRSS